MNGASAEVKAAAVPTPARTGAGGSDAIEASWEVAYVYAFVLKFTDLATHEDTSHLLTSVASLENALHASAPPLPSSAPLSPLSVTSSLSDLSDHEMETAAVPAPVVKTAKVILPEIPCPPRSELIIEICTRFKALSPDAPIDSRARKDWYGWLYRFVDARMGEQNRGGLQWEGNLMKRSGVRAGKEDDKEFWILSWETKIHLMRVAVDYLLTYSPTVRAAIDLHYDIGKQRVSKRDPLVNPLIVDPIGRTIDKLDIFHLDASARLYASGNPWKKKGTWYTLTSTRAEYESFVNGLDQTPDIIKPPKPSKAIVVDDDSDEDFVMKGAPKLASIFKKVPKKPVKGKGKAEAVDPTLAAERKMRGKLEDALPILIAHEEAVEALEAKRASELAAALQKAEQKASRVERSFNFAHEPRSTRLRNAAVKSVNYSRDGELVGTAEDGDEEEEDEEESEEDESDEEGGRRKRGRGSDSDDARSYEDESGEEGGRPKKVKKERRSGRVKKPRVIAGAPAPVEWRGERRSTRIQLGDAPRDTAASSVDGGDDSVAVAGPGPSTTKSRSSLAVEEVESASALSAVEPDVDSSAIISASSSTDNDLSTPASLSEAEALAAKAAVESLDSSAAVVKEDAEDVPIV